ncbi:uncharacterized protein LOC106163543 [Lingula anatina]|uniref:Uncharacterized protein LOC106163543 n=1 Tax=Lingula anatina TaxID=7574 RepID=A0A1S3IEF5_LINAN|nr:uncharacterized protein LOC106163543 [Lingula anatina]|eukprot:XP_013396612.1 uncharacterized protein LOC106163543 [Lingula anatina]
MKTATQISARASCLLTMTYVTLVLSVRAGVGMPTTIPQLVNNQVEHTLLGMSTSTVSYGPIPPIQDTGTSAEALTLQTEPSSYNYQAEFHKLVGAINSLVRNATDWIKSASQQLYQWGISSEKKVAWKYVLPVDSISRKTFKLVRNEPLPLKFRGFGLLTETSNSPDNQIMSTRLGVGTSTMNYGFASESAHGDDLSLDEIVGAFKEEIQKLVGDIDSYVKNFTIWIKTGAQNFSYWASQESAKPLNGTVRKRVKKHALALPKPTTPPVWKRVRLPRLTETSVVEEIKMPPVAPRVLMPPKIGMAVDSRLLGSAHLYVPPPSFVSYSYKIHLILGVVVVFFISCFAALFVGRKGKSKIIPGPYVLDGFYAYIITLRTSFKRHAGTNGKIKIQLFSNSSSSPEYVLPRSKKKVLSRGKEAMLLVYTKAPLGELTHVLVTLNGYGVKAKWHLTDLTVSDPWADREWYFANDKWLKPKHNGAAQTHTLPLTDVSNAYNLMWSNLHRIVMRYHTWIYPVFGGGQEHAEVLSRPATVLLLFSTVGNFLLGNVLMETALKTVGSHQVALHFSANTLLITFVVNAAICVANCVCEIFLGNIKSKKLCTDICDRVSAFQAHQEKPRATEKNHLQAKDSSIDLAHSNFYDNKLLFSQDNAGCYVLHEDEENLERIPSTKSLCNIARESTQASSGKRRYTMFATTHALKLSKTEMIRKKLNLQRLSRIDVETSDLPLQRSKSDTAVRRHCLLCQKVMEDPYPIHWYCKYQKAVQLGWASAPANGPEATVYDTADALCDYMGVPRLAKKNKIEPNDHVDEDHQDAYFPDVKLTDLPQQEQQIWISKLLQINPLWAAKISSLEAGKGEPASINTTTEEMPCEMQLPATNMKSELATAILSLTIFKAPSTEREINPEDNVNVEISLTLGNTEKRAAEFLNELIGDMVNMLIKGKTSAEDRVLGWQTKVFEFMTTYQKVHLQNKRKSTEEGGEGKDMPQNEEPDKHAPKLSLTEKRNRSVFDTKGFDTVVRRLSQEMTMKTITEDLSDHENEWEDDLSGRLQLNITGEYIRQKDIKTRIEAVAQTGESLFALDWQPVEEKLDNVCEPQSVMQQIGLHTGKLAPDLKPLQRKSGYVCGRSLTHLSASASVNHLKEVVPMMQAMSKTRQNASLANLTASEDTTQSNVQNMVAGTRPHLLLGELMSKIIANDPDVGLNVFKMLPIIPVDITAESLKDLAQGTAHGLLASFEDMCDIATEVSQMAMEEFSNKLVESLLQVISTKLDADKQCSQSPSTCLMTNEETESQQPGQCFHHDIPSTHTIIGQVQQLMEKEMIEIRNDENQMITEAFTYHYLDALIFNAIIRAQYAILHQSDREIQDQECQDKEQAIKFAQDLLHKDVDAFYNDNWEACKQTVQLGLLALNKQGDVFVKEQELKESILDNAKTIAQNVAALVMKKAIQEVKLKTASEAILQEVLSNAALVLENANAASRQELPRVVSADLVQIKDDKEQVVQMQELPIKEHEPPNENVTPASSNESVVSSVGLGDIMTVREELKDCRNLLNGFRDVDLMSSENRRLLNLPKASRSLDSVVRSLSEANKAMPCKKLNTSLPQVDRFEEIHRNKAFLSTCEIAPSLPSGSKDVVIDIKMKQEDVALDVIIDVEEDDGNRISEQPTEEQRPLNDMELLHVEMMVKGEFKKLLPHWVKYIIFALLICSIAVSLFFTDIYAMSFEDENLNHWLLLVGLAMLEDFIVFQPVKCLFIHFYFMVFPQHRNVINNPV